jgi:hypothetical protein
MSHSFYVLKPAAGGTVGVESIDATAQPKISLANGNPAGDAGTISKTSTLKSGSVPAGG